MERTLVVALVLLALAAGARAQAPAPSSSAPSLPGAAPEPNVQRTVIDEREVRIEELRVRGQLQRVVVSPKGGARPYEILTGEGPRQVSDGRSTSQGASGQRVWNVLNF